MAQLEAPPAVSAEYPYNGRITGWDEFTDGLAIVTVDALEAPFPFEPGQYATLGLMGTEKLVQRPMSICSTADDVPRYEFFIRLVPTGELTPLLWQRGVGDPINIKGAKGKFTLQPDGRACLLVSSGTGIAPFISMIETLLRRGERRELILLNGVSYDYDLGYRDYLERVAGEGHVPLTYVPTVSRPHECPGWTGATGRVEGIVEAQMERCGLDASNTTIYLCGNPDMVSSVEELAARRGFEPRNVRKELYWPKGRAH
ncbi:MAG: FAD-binding oxidoreductase [Chloroflexota bacterium]|nr:FAD-binding oxidoreductase [Chloroflexota bacterium]